jgi:hypothetical protein
VAHERTTNRKGTRARIGAALLGGDWPKFTASDARWRELEVALGKPIPDPIRKKLCDAISNYMADANAEQNAPHVDDYTKRLAEIDRVTNRLVALLFHGSEPIDDQVAGAVLAGLDDDEVPLDASYAEPGTLALENALRRVASNARMEINRVQGASGFIEHEAWDELIVAVGSILSDAGLPCGIAIPSYEGRVSPFVRLVGAIQLLLPETLRRHGGASLAKEMMAARKRAKARSDAALTNPPDEAQGK